MSEAFDKIWLISIRNWGKIRLRNKNERKAKCRQCDKETLPGEGLEFVAERFSGRKCGYLCRKCIMDLLRDQEEWHYNRVTGMLFPAQYFTTQRASGAALAQAWEQGGEDGLNEVLLK